MFLLKKLLSACLLPLPLAMALLVVGIAVLWLSERQRLGRWLASTGVLLLLLDAYGVFATTFLNPLEKPYSPLSADAVAALNPKPAAVVVLGSGFLADKRVPANDRLGSTGLARLVEGIRLWRLHPESKLVLSNGLGQGSSAVETATFLGVPTDRLVTEAFSMDTVDEVVAIQNVIGNAPFLLVTSAAHMRRAEALCRARGLSPIPAATDYLMSRGGWSVLDLLPNARELSRADSALHEWIGLLWARLRGAT